MTGFVNEVISNYNSIFNNDAYNLQLIFFTLILYVVLFFMIILLKKQAEISVLNKFSFKIKTILEPLNDSIRGQRKKTHEFGNQMTIVYGYLKNNELERAKSYIKKITGDENLVFNDSSLGNVYDNGLRELIAYKENIIKKNNIEFDLVIDETSDAVVYENSDVFLVMGVLLDNAIEGSLTSKEPYIAVTKVGWENGIKVIIENSVDESDVDITKVYSKGYSSKGTSRGVGLSIVNDVISRHDDLKINTYKENDMFVQELIIQNIVDTASN